MGQVLHVCATTTEAIRRAIQNSQESSWPIGEIARGVKLSDQQHAALYEVAAATYRAAGDLLASCTAETLLTPVGRLDAEREEMRGLLFGINAIQPILADFRRHAECGPEEIN